MLTPLPGGVANRAFLLRADLVLRVPRSREFAADLRKEAAILPVVSSSGVRTAELLAHGEGFVVTRRLPGSAPSDVEPRTAVEVGRELATLHGIGSRVPGVPEEAVADPHALVARLAGEGWIDRVSAAWLDGWFRKLAQPPVANVLTHGDVAPQNLLVEAGGALTGLIDWGDAAYADPATDFAKLRFASVPAALTGYRAAGAPDLEWEPRVLWHRLLWALGRLRAPAPGRAGHWTAPPMSRLLDLLHFFATDPPKPWPAWSPP